MEDKEDFTENCVLSKCQKRLVLPCTKFTWFFIFSLQSRDICPHLSPGTLPPLKHKLQIYFTIYIYFQELTATKLIIWIILLFDKNIDNDLTRSKGNLNNPGRVSENIKSKGEKG